MTAIPADRSRDVRIEDPSNLFIIHPIARALLPVAVRAGVSANAVSLIGMAIGCTAAWAYSGWGDARMASVGFMLMLAWMVADGLDGMVARATGTSSATGRLLDGLCDHGVFVLVYVTLASTIGTVQGWVLAVAAGAAHAVQSNLFESERARFHRRVRGDAGSTRPVRTGNGFERFYDSVAQSLDTLTAPVDRALRDSGDPARMAARYAEHAVPPLKLQSLLSANVRVLAIYLACLAGDPQLFWWFELLPLTGVTIAGLLWHKHATSALFASQAALRQGR